MGRPIHNPHDRYFTARLTHRDDARSLFEQYLPPAIARGLRLDRLRNRSRDFIDPELTERRGDLVFEVPLDGELAFVVLLTEHRSTPDHTCPARLLVYALRIIDEWLALHPRARTVPVVLPIIVYHGPPKWPGPARLSDLYPGPPSLRRALAHHAPELRPVVIDLTRLSLAELRGTPHLKLTLLGFALARRPRREVLRLLRESRPIWKAATLDRGWAAVRVVLRYLLSVRTDLTVEELMNTLTPIDSRAEDVVMTVADRLRAEGRKEGRDEGRRLVLKQLTLRYGELPGSVASRIAKASPQELERWAERVLTAPTLTACLDGD